VDTLDAETVDTQTPTVDTQPTVDTLDAETVDTQTPTVDTQPTADTLETSIFKKWQLWRQSSQLTVDTHWQTTDGM